MIKEINIEGESLKIQYFACSTGKIYSWKNGKMKELKGWLEHSRPGYSEKRYWRVSIGKKKYYKHRLIIAAFDRWPEPGEVVRHLNDNEFDNRRINLKIGTHQENAEDRERNKKEKEDFENDINEFYGTEREDTKAPF